MIFVTLKKPWDENHHFFTTFKASNDEQIQEAMSGFSSFWASDSLETRNVMWHMLFVFQCIYTYTYIYIKISLYFDQRVVLLLSFMYGC